MKSDILAHLTRNKFVSGTFLAKKLGITRSAVNKKIKSLISSGFVIESRKNRGYCLKKSADVLDIYRLKDYLRKTGIGEKIVYRKECRSTQLLAKKYAERTKSEMLIIAEKQSAGYGRIQRKWLSPDGGLWFSLLLFPRVLPDDVSQLTFLMALAVARTLKDRGFPAGIKWPNDVLINGKKVCGILTEMSAEMDKVYWVVVGTGINVNNEIPQKIRDIAISLSAVSGRTVDRTDLLIKILQKFFGYYRVFENSGFKKFFAEYEKFLLFRNELVQVKQLDRTISGKLVGINAKGHLIIKTNSKKVELLSGDLFKELK